SPEDSATATTTAYACSSSAAASTTPTSSKKSPFSGWTKTFTDPRLCAAIVDRLTFNGTIIETGTDSYRLAHTLALAHRANS
ncbi:DNA replication protein DnaC, partial [Arthrobacter sp. CAN_A2]|uniref:ATP-binding protein n=1 Tax=Arthrobacter sp. CAN_A2 TaxID=2787718 RepID=UPI001A29A106